MCVHIDIDSDIAVTRDAAREHEKEGEDSHHVGESTILREANRLEAPGTCSSFIEEWYIVCDGKTDPVTNARYVLFHTIQVVS